MHLDVFSESSSAQVLIAILHVWSGFPPLVFSQTASDVDGKLAKQLWQLSEQATPIGLAALTTLTAWHADVDGHEILRKDTNSLILQLCSNILAAYGRSQDEFTAYRHLSSFLVDLTTLNVSSYVFKAPSVCSITRKKTVNLNLLSIAALETIMICGLTSSSSDLRHCARRLAALLVELNQQSNCELAVLVEQGVSVDGFDSSCKQSAIRYHLH